MSQIDIEKTKIKLEKQLMTNANNGLNNINFR